MGADRFDLIIRSFGASAPRRTILGNGFAVSLAVLWSSLGGADAAGKRKKRRKRKKKK